MGQHSKKVDCNTCNGKGGWYESDDGNRRWVTCWACSGTGKQ